MKNKHVAIVGFSIGFSIVCLIWGVLWMIMAKDLSEKVDILEQEIVNYQWQLEQVDKMICIGE